MSPSALRDAAAAPAPRADGHRTETLRLPLRFTPARLRSTGLASVGVAFLLATAACGDRSDPLLHLQANGSLRITPSALSLDDGSTVEVTATLRDASGNRVSEVPGASAVTWSAFGPTVVAVQGQGLTARVSGLKPGQTTLRASLGSLTATATVGVAPVAHRISSAGPPVTLGLSGELAPHPARVQVLDRHDSPVPYVVVSFDVIRGGGGVAKSRVVTDEFGFAETPWVLGPDLGPQTVRASANGVEPAHVVAYVNGDLASASLTAISRGGSAGTVGTPLDDLLEVRARDAQGRPVLGVGVEWTASAGTLLPTAPVTDALGVARARWILGPNPGLQSASVRLVLPQEYAGGGEGVSREVVVTFQADAAPTEATRISVLPRRMVLELGGAARANVALLDALGNVIPGPYATEWSFLDDGILTREAHPSGDAILSGTRQGETRVVVAVGPLADTIDALVNPVGQGGGTGTGPVASLDVAPDTLVLAVGRSGGLTAAARDAAGNLLPSGDAVWSAASTSVASVDAFGRVTATGPGVTWVTAVLDGIRDSSLVVVASTDVTPGVPLRLGDVRVVGSTSNSIEIAFSAGDDGTGAPARHEIRYAPAPLGWGWGLASVVGTGSCASPFTPPLVGAQTVCRIDGLSPGRAYDIQMVTWRDDGADRFFSPLSNIASGATLPSSGSPEDRVDDVVILPRTAVVAPGGTVVLTATAVDASGAEVGGLGVSWDSTNEGVATVDASGRVTGVAEGAVSIRATIAGKTASASVSVASGSGGRVATVAVAPSPHGFDKIGLDQQMVGVAYDAAGNIVATPLSWSSSNPSVASISSSGLLVARGEGTTVVTATADCCGVSGTADVWVRVSSQPPPPSTTVSRIEVSPSNGEFTTAGQTRQYTATAYDAAGAAVTTGLSWRSSNTSVATVSSSGVVTAKASGTATITATADCCSVSGSAQATVTLSSQPPPPPPPPPATGDAWFAIDFDRYGSVAEIEAIPGVTLTGIQEHTLTTGLSGTGWGGRKALRLNFPVSRSAADMGLGLEIVPPDRESVRVREVWIEVWARYSPTWTTAGVEVPTGWAPGSYTGSHKFLLMYDQSHDSYYRWEDMQGVFSTTGEHQVMIAGGTKGIGRAGHTFEYDGQWHRYRYHARMDEVNGRFMLDMDGAKRIGFEGPQDTSQSPSHYFAEFQFGANNNRGTDGVNDMWYEIAGIRIYRGDPGWGF